MDGSFSLEDMLAQMRMLKKMGPLGGLMRMMPGMGQLASAVEKADTDKMMKVNEAIIQSMTPYERSHPSELRSSHKNRIARGSGTSVADVNKLISSFDKTKRMMAQMGLGKYRKY